MFEFYKIKNPNKEEYSAGLRHGYIQATKKGKTWESLGYVKSHILAATCYDEKAFAWYGDWIILKITPEGIVVIGTVKDFIKGCCKN